MIAGEGKGSEGLPRASLLVVGWTILVWQSPHLAYAITWIGVAALVLAYGVWGVTRRIRGKRGSVPVLKEM